MPTGPLPRCIEKSQPMPAPRIRHGHHSVRRRRDLRSEMFGTARYQRYLRCPGAHASIRHIERMFSHNYPDDLPMKAVSPPVSRGSEQTVTATVVSISAFRSKKEDVRWNRITSLTASSSIVIDSQTRREFSAPSSGPTSKISSCRLCRRRPPAVPGWFQPFRLVALIDEITVICSS